MRRFAVFVLVAALLAVAAGPRASSAVAQESPGSPGVGSAVPYVGPDGSELGRITVNDLIAPFEDYDPSSPPPRGSHYVLLDVTVLNTGAQPFVVDPSDIFVQDTEGFIVYPSYVDRGSEPAVPDLADPAELAPGGELSGVVGFAMLTGTEVARVFFQPARDRLILLADLTVAGPGPAPEPEPEPEPTEPTVAETPTLEAVIPTVAPPEPEPTEPTVITGDETPEPEPTRDLIIGGETPEPEPTVTADPPVQTGVVGNTYTSPNWGYSISWDETIWEVGDESTRPGYDLLLLRSPLSSIYIEGLAGFGDDPAGCLDDAVNFMQSEDGVSDYTLAVDDAGNPIAGEDATSAYAAYTLFFTGEDGTTLNFANYLECRTLPGQDAAVVITQIVLAEEYNNERQPRAELLANLVLPDPSDLPDQPDLPGTPVAIQGANHVQPGEAHEPYTTSPPTSGPHYPQVAPWGVSAVPIEDELQVHNLEHGGVMLQYNCVCPEAIALLESFADPAQGGYPTKVIAAPYPDMAYEVALTAWGRILPLTTAEVTEEIVRDFIEAYIDRGPEHIASETAILEEWRAAGGGR